MRYRDGPLVPDVGPPGSDSVSLTVAMTLAIGVGFLIVGWRGRQWWLAIWGAITIVICGVYYALAP